MQPDTLKKPEVLTQGATTLATPNPPSATFNASNIGTQPVTFPQYTPPAPPSIPVKSVDEQAKSFAEATQPTASTAAETAQTTAQSTFQKLSEKMFGKSAAQAAAETTQGIPEKSKAVSDIQSQINQLQNEATQASLTAEGRQAPMFAITGEQAQIERMRSVKALQLNSFLYAAQGNLATAQSMADKAVAAQFDPIEAQIKYTKDWLDMNKDTLSREDKKRADALTLTLNERTRLLEQQKADKTAVNNVALEAAKNGADAVTLNNISKAKTVDEAITAAGATLASPTTDVVKLDNGNTVVIDKRTGKVIKELGGAKGTGAMGEEGQSNLNTYAQQFASDGKLPAPAALKAAGLTVGQVAEAAKALPKPKGALVSANTGVAPSNLSATQVEGITAMNEIVNDTLPRLKELFPKLYTGLVGGTLGGAFTSQDRQDYNTFKADFISKLLKARSGAAVTEQEYQRYAKLLPGTFNQLLFLGSDGLKKLESLDKSMNVNLKNTLNTNQLAIYGYTPVKLKGDVSGKEYKVGDILNMNGIQAVVLADGTLAIQ